MRVTKQHINDLFKALRKAGFFARQNYLCCGSCAAAAADEECKKRGITKVALYHRQDAESAWSKFVAGRRVRSDVLVSALYLQYGAPTDSPLTTEEVGHEIVRIAHSLNLHVVWDGSANTRILIGSFTRDDARNGISPGARVRVNYGELRSVIRTVAGVERGRVRLEKLSAGAGGHERTYSLWELEVVEEEEDESFVQLAAR